MMEAQVIAKTWKRRMRDQITNEDQERDYNNFNRNYGDVYNMIQEEQQQEDAEDSDDDVEMMAANHHGAREERKQGGEAKKKGGFKGLMDAVSHQLFKASKMNRNQF